MTSSNGKSVKLRSGPGKTYGEVGEAEVGKAVTVIEQGKNWTKIQIDGQTCYIMSSFLSSTKPSITPAPTATAAKSEPAYVVSANGASVRVRKGAGTSYSVVGEVAYGTQVLVDGTKGTWSHITAGSVTGYIMSRYLTANKPEATMAPTGTAAAAATAKAGTTAYIVSDNGKSVNVRKRASATASVVTSLSVGTQVTVTEKGSTWSAITGSFGEGYVKNTFLSDTKPEVKEEAGYSSFTAYVYSDNGKSVRVRKGAGSGYATVTSLEVGTEVTVVGESGNWYQITFSSSKGYIMKSYISTIKPTAPEETKEEPTWIPANGSKVYIASTSSRVVRTYTVLGGSSADGKAFPVGTPATVVSTQNGWAELNVGGTAAYLKISNLASTGAAAIPGSANRLINYLTGTFATVEVRRAKLADSGSLGNYLVGTAVIVMSRNSEEGWAYIQVGSTKGYVDLTNLKSKP